MSQWVRLRDGRCMRCKSPVQLNDKGMPITHQCSHYFGRRKEGTRFEPDNCDTLCHGCHRYWEKEDREAYREFKMKQLGPQRHATLHLQANSYHKKDRLMEKLKWQQALKDILNNKS